MSTYVSILTVPIRVFPQPGVAIPPYVCKSRQILAGLCLGQLCLALQDARRETLPGKQYISSRTCRTCSMYQTNTLHTYLYLRYGTLDIDRYNKQALNLSKVPIVHSMMIPPPLSTCSHLRQVTHSKLLDDEVA